MMLLNQFNKAGFVSGLFQHQVKNGSQWKISAISGSMSLKKIISAVQPITSLHIIGLKLDDGKLLNAAGTA